MAVEGKPQSKLELALAQVDWDSNIAAFLADGELASRISVVAAKTVLWAKQFEAVDAGNPAITFMRELQVLVQHVSTLIALGLYKPAAASMRSMLEASLYYTYFRSHPVELASIGRNSGFYVDKQYIIEFHKSHTVDFIRRETKLGLVSLLNKWYLKISAIVHGQKPGSWVKQVSIASTKHDSEAATACVENLEHCYEIIRKLLLCTSAQDAWIGFTSTAKAKFLAGIPGDQKAVLGLDLA